MKHLTYNRELPPLPWSYDNVLGRGYSAIVDTIVSDLANQLEHGDDKYESADGLISVEAYASINGVTVFVEAEGEMDGGDFYHWHRIDVYDVSNVDVECGDA